MSNVNAITINSLSKAYQIYDKPIDRLKQMIFPRIQRMIGMRPRMYHREFWALKDVSFKVKKGETVGIVGHNGSGKSTLLQIICGTLNSTDGRVKTEGRIAALLELGSGFNPEFTGRENIYMNAAILGLSKDEIDARFEQIVSFADIGDFIEQPVKAFSSGMVLRLAFAVAINVDPEILIVDEALSVGDELFQRKCFARIESIRARGSTILFVSHSGSQIIEYCDRAVLLDSGELIFSGSPRDTVGVYQKLLYSSADSRGHVRAEIILKSNKFLPSSVSLGTPELVVTSKASMHLNIQETYDPNLIPTSTVEFESHGPLIGIPSILTEDGRKVNGLIRGRKYRCCYRVNFSRAASGVRFGMAIKSTTGLTLAGALSASDHKSAICVISEGASFDVQFKFDCNLNPGLYFVNAGVFGMLNGVETVLHRRAEIIAFRVLPVGNNIETEIVSLSFQPFVSVHE